MREAFEQVHMPPHIMIEHRNVAAGHVRNGDVVRVERELVQNATHRNHIVIRVRREHEAALAGRQFAAAANASAEEVEHLAVDRAGRAVSRDE